MTEDQGQIIATLILVGWMVLILLMQPMKGSGSFAESFKRTFALMLSIASGVAIIAVLVISEGRT